MTHPEGQTRQIGRGPRVSSVIVVLTTSVSEAHSQRISLRIKRREWAQAIEELNIAIDADTNRVNL